jgi:hypothetical protein
VFCVELFWACETTFTGLVDMEPVELGETGDEVTVVELDDIESVELGKTSDEVIVVELG